MNIYSPSPDPSAWADFWQDAIVLVKASISHNKETEYLIGQIEALRSFGDWLCTQPGVPNDFKSGWQNLKTVAPGQPSYTVSVFLQATDRLLAACSEIEHTRFDLINFLRDGEKGKAPFTTMMFQMRDFAKNNRQLALEGMIDILDPSNSFIPGFSFIKWLYGPLIPPSSQSHFSIEWGKVRKNIIDKKNATEAIDQFIQQFKEIQW